MKNYQLLICFLIFSKCCFGQGYLLDNEEVIFSFKTSKGKKMVLAKDKENEYIIYRFGTEEKIELEYPEKNKESWSKFTYFYYSKPGGPKNSGMHVNSVHFKIDGYQYSIFQNEYSRDDERDDMHIGILIENEKKNKRKKIMANSCIEGSLFVFLDNNLLPFDDIQNYE